jgi:hypothetical protein
MPEPKVAAVQHPFTQEPRIWLLVISTYAWYSVHTHALSGIFQRNEKSKKDIRRNKWTHSPVFVVREAREFLPRPKSDGICLMVEAGFTDRDVQ